MTSISHYCSDIQRIYDIQDINISYHYVITIQLQSNTNKFDTTFYNFRNLTQCIVNQNDLQDIPGNQQQFVLRQMLLFIRVNSRYRVVPQFSNDVFTLCPLLHGHCNVILKSYFTLQIEKIHSNLEKEDDRPASL